MCSLARSPVRPSRTLTRTLPHGPCLDRATAPPDPDARVRRFNPRHGRTRDDNLSILDLESIVLTGQIIERQRDRPGRELKYVIEGTTLGGEGARVVAKIGPNGKLFVITVYVL
jgi:hypothetical protein